jgi:type I restriction enzyme, S subunit
MELKAGYKNSEIGVIPEDWEVKRLKNALRIRHGKSQKQVEVTNGKYPILGTGGKMGTTNSFLYNKPSVLIGRKGTIDKPRYMETPFWTVDTLFYSEVFSNALPKYLYYNFLLIDWYSHNEASGVPSLNASKIENIQIPLPPLPEQIAIATVLSDTDSLIQALEKKIAKKQLIKKGAMQKLLTPKEGWEVKPLGEICDKIQDGNYGESYPKSDEFQNSGVPFLTSKAIGKDGALKINLIDFISTEKHFELAKAHIQLNDILFTNRGASVGAIGYVDERIAGGNIGPQLTLIRTNSGVVNSLYLFQYLKTDTFRRQIIGKDSGSAMNFFGIGQTEKFIIPLPSLNEQTRFAQILSNMDSEIEALNKKLAKYKQLKQGLMQNLLTGKIRLKT